MKTRTTKLTVTPGELFHEMGFEIEIVDEASGEFVEVRSNSEGHPLRIDCSEWPFLRDAIDRMFVEIAEHESEGKLKKLFETPAAWEKASEEQAPPATTPQGAASGEEQVKPASDDGWILWNGGKCPVDLDCNVLVRLRSEAVSDPAVDPPRRADDYYWKWDGMYPEGDIIAYKVVD